MYAIQPSLYRKVGERLVEAIGTKEYFSGCIHLIFDDIDCELCTTLIIERDAQPTEGYCFKPITGLIPIWWEFHTYKCDEEILNDFSFRELAEATL